MSKETVLYEDKIWKFLITKHEGQFVFFAKYIPSFINSGWKYFDSLKSCKTFAEEYTRRTHLTQISKRRQNVFNNKIP